MFATADISALDMFLPAEVAWNLYAHQFARLKLIAIYLYMDSLF